MRPFRTLRGRLTALAFVATAVAVSVPVLVFNIVLAARLDRDADSRLRAQAVATGATVSAPAGRARIRGDLADSPIDARVWIYAGSRALLRARGEARIQRTASSLARGPGGFRTLGDLSVRFYAAPVRIDGTRVATVVVARSLEPAERAEDVARIESLALGGILVAVVGLLTWLAIGRALGPVEQMTRSVAEWRTAGEDRRFGRTQRPAELARLAATFDELLDRVSSSLRHEQRLSAELSHELRTPLARVIAETELLRSRERSPAEREEAYDAVLRNTEQMQQIIETLMTAARAEANLDRHGRTDVGPVIRELADAWRPAFTDAGLELETDAGATRLITGVDREVLDRILAPLLDNALIHARARVDVSADATGAGRVFVRVVDDGRGVADTDRERIFDPGVRGPSAAGDGAGLGLALARRLARAAGGDVTAEDDAQPGATFRVDLPT